MTNYGMFTAIVDFAFKNRLEWSEVMPLLRNLASSDYELYGEATDTVVREAVYEALLLTAE